MLEFFFSNKTSIDTISHSLAQSLQGNKGSDFSKQNENKIIYYIFLEKLFILHTYLVTRIFLFTDCHRLNLVICSRLITTTYDRTSQLFFSIDNLNDFHRYLFHALHYVI